MKPKSMEQLSQKVEITNQISNDISNSINTINKITTETLKGTEDLNKYILPLANIEELINFYETFIKVAQSCEKAAKEFRRLGVEVKSNVESLEEDTESVVREEVDAEEKQSEKEENNEEEKDNFLNKMQNFTFKNAKDIEFCKEIICIESYYFIKETLLLLEPYKHVNNIKKHINLYHNYFKSIINPINKKYFDYLAFVLKILNEEKTKTQIDEVKLKDAQKCAIFLVETRGTDFTLDFCDSIIGFKIPEKLTPETLVEYLKKFAYDFGRLEECTKKILGPKESDLINLEIKKMIVIKFKTKAIKCLMDMENDYRDENIIHACRIHIIMTGDEKSQDFVEFKEEVLRIINNLLLRFINNISLTKITNPAYKNEHWLLVIYEIYRSFENENLENDFFMKYQHNFLFSNASEMKFYLSDLALDKVYDLAKNLKGIQKNVYLINNLFLINTIHEVYKDVKIKDLMVNLADEIGFMWKKECDSKTKEYTKKYSAEIRAKMNRFIDINLSTQRKYYLPGNIRDYTREKVADVIIEFAATIGYYGGEEKMFDQISYLFSGE